jgi:hypothetical protein
MFTCPENHCSETPDFCSVCGAEMAARPAASAPDGPDGAEKCPTCDAPRVGTQVFCEACGYNFRTGAPGAAAPARAPSRRAAPRGRPRDVRWDVVVRVDARLYGKANPDAPVAQPTQTFTLFETENLIGRQDEGIRAQVPIRNDPSVSRRQALLIRTPEGGLLVRDLGSANGTQLNGEELVPGVDRPVRDGDAIAVGAWTHIAVRAVLS